MDYGGCIVSRIFSQERVVQDRFPEISLPVSLPYAFIYCLSQVPAYYMDILSHLDEYNSKAGVLTYGERLLPCNFYIFEEMTEDLLADRRFLHLRGLLQGVDNVLAKTG